MITSAQISFQSILLHTMQYRLFHYKSTIKLLLAFLVLSLGLLIYLFDRPTNTIIFLQWLPFHINSDFSFGTLGDSLPSFAHTYAFIVISSVFISMRIRSIVIAWLLLEIFFEIIQLDVVSIYLTNTAIFNHTDSALINAIKMYCINGTFDWLDIIAICMGTLLAYITIQKGNLKNPGPTDTSRL